MLEGGLPALPGVGGGGAVELDPLPVHGHAGQGHVVLPADESPYLAHLCIKDGHRTAIPLSPDEPLGGRGFKFTMFTEKFAVRSEVVKLKLATGGRLGAVTVTLLVIELVAPSLSVTVS